ncbi:leucine-rich repeat domain-containing protein [Calothrix sp. PCC 6303]|uniref:leucine-rich repeat domain-containing protein n=1 Tax=Calothrix sp. PCC 6303 TaxID=1170562 RepID=UPI0002A029A7|nr:leucine-rich repeat domain-containing protein [Calothrix sp. PCC 6303]AFZ00785.1 small GTP-binding protein [Calothrix sp. PCC 6303]
MTQDELLELIDRAVAEGWRELDLSGQELTELPGEIGKLQQLESLILGKKLEGYERVGSRILEKVSGNNLKTLPLELLGLPNLRKLDISGNPLESIPDVVTQILHLEELILIRVELTEIPEAIANLSNLTQLYFNSNHISKIPELIAKLSNLRELHVSSNKITEIPEAIAKLSNLRELHVSSNQITEIPEAIANLSNLRELHVSSNQITEIPEAIAKLINLRELQVSSNKITEIPEVIAKLTNLRKLYLRNNQITEIPEVIAKLTNLTQLDLSYNQITKISEALAKLINLTQIILHNNKITEIPDALAKLINLTQLDLSYNQITKIPEALAKLTNLTQLILYSNQITEIPEVIAKLTNLTQLDLSYNQITKIPEALAKLTNLTQLILYSNRISEIPEALAKLINLTQIILSYNRISEIPEALAKLTNLTQLDLSYNQITKIPEALAKLINLTQIILHSNKITEIPEALAKLTNLRQLYLSYNRITEIPEALAKLTNLTQLNLSDNQIIKIPKALAKLSNLTQLDLNRNKITEIPEALAKLTNLTQLYLRNNRITEIPEALAKLTNLTQLDLGTNYNISEIPEAITKLTNLTQLNLTSSQITEIPEVIAKLTNLTQLNLTSNQIAEIPEAIAKLTNLTQLILTSNQITEIPEAIAKLTNLTQLNLTSNQITKIPEAIAKLTNLTQLILSYNQITEIPEAIAKLTNLTQLILTSNQITEIPDAITKLTNLTQLDLSYNRISEIPLEILDSKDPKEILNYLRQISTSETRPLHEAKLLLVGQGSVGKTSLIERLIHDKYDKNQHQTDGLKVQTWNVSVKNQDIRLNVWDFGGQEIYHATHQFFLTKRSLYLLVCNCRTSEEENRIEYWLKLIESFGGQSPVIIVGNKKDEQPLDINRKALREKYPNIDPRIIETSCQDNIGINELRDAILDQVGNLKEVYDLLPLSWFEVKKQLESMTEDFITYNRYIGICHENKIPEEQNQDQLIDLLHRLGLVLNYRDHPILKNLNVLKPNWVTEGIYALLSDENLKTKTKGIFTDEDLSRILNKERYPTQRHDDLINLMKKFELCFQLECYPPKFLIAGLLPKDQPDATKLEGETLEFQYHYKVLPESIISRFIVNTHEKIHNQIYWRSGVMLQYQENNEIYNIARIKADPEDKRIFITISGRKETRRLFLGILRDVFHKIHNTLPNLEITEWVPVPNHPNHPPLDYQELLGLESMGVLEYPIGKLKININIRQLLDGYESRESRQKIQKGDPESDRFRINIYNQNNNNNHQGEYKPMTEITNNNQGANIANFANEVKDNASQQASNFTQTSGASVAELMQLIGNLRQTANQFPAETRDDMIIEIDDVEVEIKKPEKERNIPKLKKRLAGLLTAATVVATPIAEMAGFTNTVLEIGQKVGIELKLPSGK